MPTRIQTDREGPILNRNRRAMYNQAGNADVTLFTTEGIQGWVASGQSLRFSVTSSSASASFEEGRNQDGVDINVASLNVSKGFKEMVDRRTGFHASEGIVRINITAIVHTARILNSFSVRPCTCSVYFFIVCYFYSFFSSFVLERGAV